MRLRVRVRVFPMFDRVKKAAKLGNVKSLFQAAAYLRTTASRSIRRRKGPSKVGTPPHTHTGLLKHAIIFHVNKMRDDAIVGPDAAIVGDFAQAHEYGGLFRGQYYERRPFMGPALTKIRPRLPAFWASSVRG